MALHHLQPLGCRLMDSLEVFMGFESRLLFRDLHQNLRKPNDVIDWRSKVFLQPKGINLEARKVLIAQIIV